MGGTTDTQQLVKELTRLSFVTKERNSKFNRKTDCVTALSELKYEAEQGRHDYWHKIPKLIEVMESLIGKNTVNIDPIQNPTDLLNIWKAGKTNIAKRQLPLHKFTITHAKLIATLIERQATRLTDEEYERGIKIRQASHIVCEIEQRITRTEEVLYLHYLIQVFDTAEGMNALSFLIKNLKHKHPEMGEHAEQLQQLLQIPTALTVKKDYTSIINKIYDTAEQSRLLHDKTTNMLMELRYWLSFTLIPDLETHHDILARQSELIGAIKTVWIEDYSQSEILDKIKQLSVLVDQEQESKRRIKEEISHYMRNNEQMKEILSFTKSAQQELMSHHAHLFQVAVLSYNLFPLVSAFYSVDEFDHYWDAAEEFILPTSSIKRMFSTMALRVFAGLL